MAWIAEERRTARTKQGEPLLTADLKKRLEDVYFPRYPTRRAVLLPALHAVQHEYGWIPPQAMEEIAAFLDISSAEVLDTASFYEEYWLKPKGKYLVAVCRSLSCEVCQHADLTKRVMEKCNVEVGETSDDGRFTLVELECLGACGTAPVALINDVLHEELTPDKLEALIDGLPEDPHDYQDPTVTWPTSGH
ncbi:MAG: complex I 24 kDa subunit family protein [Phycisphaerae bacterium]